MSAFFDLALAWPTVVFTVMVAVSLVYWGFVILGALDIDMLDFGGADSLEGADGLLEGADGALEGADGALDGATDGAMEAAGEGAEAGGSVLVDVMNALKLRRAPFTVVFSFIALFGWTVSMIAMHYVGPAGGLLGAAVGLGAFAAALPITSVVIRPLGPVFQTHSGRRRSALIGQSCTVTTGRVDHDFGQATCVVGKDELLIQVRCPADKQLGRDQEALIIEYDEEREAYVVEPLAGDGAAN